MPDLEKVEWIQLDKQQFTLLVLRLPEMFTMHDVEFAEKAANQLREAGVRQVLILPPGWDVEFAQQEEEEERHADV